MNKRIQDIATDLKYASAELLISSEQADRIRKVAQWVVNAYEDPDNQPQTLEFQINQLKEALKDK